MAHVQPLGAEATPELEPIFAIAEAAMGFVPNSMRTMAHMPQLPVAFLMLTSVAFGADLKSLLGGIADRVPAQGDPQQNLPPAVVQLIAFAASISAGCRYCQAHTAHSAHRLGEAEEKLSDILSYTDSALYTPAERAVLDLAFAAGRVPNEASEAHFTALRAHYSDRQIVQIVAVVAVFGFLNRWNDTMATTLEAAPTGFADAALAGLGWQPGKHG